MDYGSTNSVGLTNKWDGEDRSTLKTAQWN